MAQKSMKSLTDTNGNGEASAFSSVTVRDAAYARIRAKIASCEAGVRAWKRRHNELSIASRLPSELLAIVFKYTVVLSQRGTLDWIHVSHVCSDWRRVALDYPSLWSDIPFDCPKWAEEMLARSKKAPLTMAITFKDYHQVALRRTSAISIAMTQLSRVRELALVHRNDGSLADSKRLYEKFMESIRLLDSPLPVLETLVISFTTKDDRNQLPEFERFFTGGSARLTCLRLSGCGLTWQAGPIFTSLRSLEVRNIPNASRQPLEQFISALRNMPGLETLLFSSEFSPTIGAHIAPAKMVTLPCLRQITIETNIHDCVLLLERISYPDIACVRIAASTVMCRDDSEDLRVARTLAETLAKRAQVAGPTRSLAVHDQRVMIYTAPGVFPSPSPGATAYNPPVPQLDFALVHAQTTQAQASAITMDILRPLSLRYMQSLKVDTEDALLPNIVWNNHFGDLSELESLHISTDDHDGFLAALSSGTSAAREKSDQNGSLKFKALRNLKIQGWILDENHGSSGYGKTCIESLKDCLNARQKEGMPLSELELKECYHVEEDDVEELEKIVEVLEWDGESMTTSSDEEELEGSSSDEDDDECDRYYGRGYGRGYGRYRY